jgi:hypothetical protein
VDFPNRNDTLASCTDDVYANSDLDDGEDFPNRHIEIGNLLCDDLAVLRERRP